MDISKINLLESETTFINDSWFSVMARKKRDLQYSPEFNGKCFLVAVFGGAAYTQDTKEWRLAYDVGYAIAKKGGVVVSGGYEGVMGGASAGAKDAGGVSIGITCENLPEAHPNQYITHEWKVPRWDQRMIGLIWLSDAYVVMPGSSGTLVELAMVLETQRKGFIPRRNLVCYGDFWKDVVHRIESEESKSVNFAYNAEVCVDLAVRDLHL